MFRFSIRDVLWLTVVVAVSLGWWISYANLHRQRKIWKDRAQDLKLLVEMSGYEVDFDDSPHNTTGLAPAGTIETIAKWNRQADAEQQRATQEASADEPNP